MEIVPSQLMLESISAIITSERGVRVKASFGTFYDGPPGGFEKKVLFVPAGSDEAQRVRCRDLFFRATRLASPAVRIWMTTEAPCFALVIDPPPDGLIDQIEAALKSAFETDPNLGPVKCR